MNNELEMSPLSVTEFLEEMRKEPRTLNWDALLFFSRDKTNSSLTQQYIDRFSSGTHFPPFENTEEPIGQDNVHVLMGLTMDKPRLSFVNANIEESKAALKMRMVDGKMVELKEAYKGGKLIRTINMMGLISPVAGPVLDMNVELKTADSIVGAGGKVVLDLKDGYDLMFSGTGDSDAGRKLALHLQKLMDAWPDHFTRFELSKLIQLGISPLDPIDFFIRTRTAPGANVASSQNYGDGEVVLFITLKDGQNGQFPSTNNQLLNMLPDASRPYSCNLVLGHAYLMKKVILAWAKRVPWLIAANLAPSSASGSKGTELKATAGGHTFERFLDSKSDGRVALSVWAPEMQFNYAKGASPLKLNIQGDKLTIDWVSETHNRVCNWKSIVMVTPPYGDTGTISYSLTAKLHAEFKFIIDQNASGPILKLTRTDSYARADVAVLSNNSSNNAPLNQFREMLDGRAAKDAAALAAQIDGLEINLAAAGLSIDAFRLGNLLFQGPNVIAPREVHWPFDLTALGDLDPPRTQLVVTPTELTLTAGSSFQFTCTPNSSVTWSVHNLPGESGDKGIISTSGYYTAPSAASLADDGHRRVIVTATSGSMVSKALVSLVAHDISVYPMVVKVQLGQQRSLSAGTPGNKDLAWSVPSGMGRPEADSDPNNKNGCVYFAPTSMPPRQSTDPLAYDSIRLVPVTVNPRAGGTAATVDVLITAAQSDAYWLEVSAQGASQVKLTFYYLHRDTGRTEVPAADTEWTKLKGAGTLEGGVYTPNAGSSEQYAIVVACRKSDDTASQFAYMIIPVPFVSSHEFVNMLDSPGGQASL